jgi:aerobic carbon-monoxide dehydrogenase small subunit
MNPSQRVLRFHLNGQSRDVLIEPNAILLDVLREQLHLTGSKRGCDMGTCGCCTVLIDGQNRLSCLTLAAQAEGRKVTTVEGLGTGDALHPIQAAYSDVGGSQCGFCTPGFIMTTKALLDKNPKPNVAEIREAISGNLCRCTGYIKIIEAVQTAARDLQPASKQAQAPIVSARREPA